MGMMQVKRETETRAREVVGGKQPAGAPLY